MVSSPGGGKACLPSLTPDLRLANFGLFNILREGLKTTSCKTHGPALIPKPFSSHPNQLIPWERALYMP